MKITFSTVVNFAVSLSVLMILDLTVTGQLTVESVRPHLFSIFLLTIGNKYQKREQKQSTKNK